MNVKIRELDSSCVSRSIAKNCRTTNKHCPPGQRDVVGSSAKQTTADTHEDAMKITMTMVARPISSLNTKP